MARSAKRFAELLQEGISAAADRAAKSKGVIRDQLGYAIGRKGGSAIEYWGYGDGHIPRQQAEVAALARALVEAGNLDQCWLTAFLESAGYPEREQLIAEIFPHASDQPPHNLPFPTNAFIGRQDELRAVRDHLHNPACRLLTIVGAGGMGKSSLGLAVAHQTLPSFPDGVYLVPLVGINSATDLAPALVTALGLETAESGSERERLIRFLRNKRLLLVLDNFEHLSPSGAFLSELLQAAPHLKLLVTSRQRLALQEEWLFPLHGLKYPTQNPSLPAESYPAIELFVQRARQFRPDFSLLEEETAVAAICRLVEGMPLAIELAANWVRVMPCTEIAAELTEDLDFLHSTTRNLPWQQRSMRSVFEHSWKLLSAQEQRILRQLSVFRGGFTTEAAVAVADTNSRLLSDLVDQSLVHWERASDRFSMHELLRQYSAEKLAAAPGEEAQTRRRHCDYYSQQLAQMNWFLDRTKQETTPAQHRKAFEQITGEIDNVRAAWQYAVDQQDGMALRRMMNMMVEYHDEAGAWDTGKRAFDDAIAAFRAADMLPGAEQASLLGALLLRRTWFMVGHLNKETNRQLLAESLALLRQGEQGDSTDAALALVNLGARSSALGWHEEGAAQLAEALAIFRKRNHEAGIGHALSARGTLAMGWGRMAESFQFLTQAVTHLENRSQALYWWSKHLLGVACMMQGRYRQSEGNLAGARAYFVELNPNHGTVAYATRNLGDLATATGDFERATFYFAEARSRFAAMGQEWLISIPMAWGPGDLARLQGDWEEAERQLEGNVDTARQIGFEQRLATNLHNLSQLRYDQGRYAEAKELLDESLRIARRIDFRFAMAQALCQLGHVHSVLDRTQARPYYAEALQIAQAEQMDRTAAEIVRGVAEEMASTADLTRATEFLALASNHVSSNWETRQKAQRRLSELAAHLPADCFAAAVARGETLDLRRISLSR